MKNLFSVLRKRLKACTLLREYSALSTCYINFADIKWIFPERRQKSIILLYKSMKLCLFPSRGIYLDKTVAFKLTQFQKCKSLANLWLVKPEVIRPLLPPHYFKRTFKKRCSYFRYKGVLLA